MLHPAVLAKDLHDFLYKGAIDPKQTLSGYGGLTIGGYVGHWLRAYRPAQEIVTHYQFGAMGPEIAMMIGSGAAAARGAGLQAAYKGAPSVAVCGDGGCGMSLMEIETAVRYKVPLISIIYNNNCWGSYNFSRNAPKSMHLHLFQENMRYDKVAEGFGARGEYVHTPEGIPRRLEARLRHRGQGVAADRHQLPGPSAVFPGVGLSARHHVQSRAGRRRLDALKRDSREVGTGLRERSCQTKVTRSDN